MRMPAPIKKWRFEHPKQLMKKGMHPTTWCAVGRVLFALVQSNGMHSFRACILPRGALQVGFCLRFSLGKFREQLMQKRIRPTVCVRCDSIFLRKK